MMTPVEKAILKGWELGQSFNLDECLYGLPHWVGDPPDRPYPYYFFLAGMAASQNCRNALELGTHMGGSTLAIRKGIRHKLDAIVTIDLTDLSDPVLQQYPEITKIQGSASDPAIISRVIEIFEGKRIDLLYIDTFHDYENTMQHYGIFNTLLRPKVVIFDDIFLTPSMRKMWLDIRRALPRQSSDTTVVSDEIRNLDAGFGVVLNDAEDAAAAVAIRVTDIEIAPFETAESAIDGEALSNPTEQRISFRGCWREAREHFAPIVRLGSGDALNLPDRRLCIFADTATKSVYASTFAQGPGQEMICATPPGSFPPGRMIDISARASTALGYVEIEIEGKISRTWWEAGGRMCIAEPRVLIGAPSVNANIEDIEIGRLIV